MEDDKISSFEPHLLANSFSLEDQFRCNKAARLRIRLLLTAVVALASCSGDFNPDTVTSPMSRAPSKLTAENPKLGDARDSLRRVELADHPRRIPNRYIIQLNSVSSEFDRNLAAISSVEGVRIRSEMSRVGLLWVDADARALAILRRDPLIDYIEAEITMPLRGVGDTAVALVPGQFALDRVDQRTPQLDGQYLWSATGHGVHIWIVDNGVDQNALLLGGRVSATEFYTHSGKNALESCAVDNRHGTNMALRAAGSLGRGVAHAATVHSARVDGSSCSHIESGAVVSALHHIAVGSPRPAPILAGAHPAVAPSSDARMQWLAP